METRPLHWHEGLLVLPHHMQALHANLLDSVATSRNWLRAYGYGLREIELNHASLANFQLRVSRLQACLKDGTLLSVPENAHLDTLELQEAFEHSTEVYVHVLVPEREPGRPAAQRERLDGNGRFVIHEEEWEDETCGGDSRTIETHRLNARLLATTDLRSPKGFESLPIAKLKRAGADEGIPQLDTDYVPPVLACDAWKPLVTEYLVPIQALLGAFIKAKADYLRTHGGWSEANQPQVRREIMRLHTVNGWYPYLSQLLDVQGVAPLHAYLELCRAVGQFSLFRDDWLPPVLPAYDHDRLGEIFGRVRFELEQSLKTEGTESAVARYPFMGVQDCMEVSLEPAWLAGGYDFFVGVQSDLPPDRLEILFDERWLDWKLGSRRTILQIYRNAEPGLSLNRLSGVHPLLPALKDMTYFQIDRSGYYWEQVAESRALALKFNEKYLRGSSLGQKTVTVIDPKNRPRDLGLELFVVKHG